MESVCFAFLLALIAVKLANGSGCPDHFIRLGSFCYHFSDIEEDWVGARGVCEGIGSVYDETIVLGVLDYGFNIHNNQLLLTNASERGGSYWMGGRLADESGIWRWIDHSNREIDLHANYWSDKHPTAAGNCLMVTKTTYRSYLKAADCSQRSKVICQVIPKEMGFRSIFGRDNLFFSAENSISPKSTWQEARDFCSSLQPPNNNFDHVDLAVLGVSHVLDQGLLKVIAQHGNTSTWLGGRHIAYGNDSVSWIDDRSVEDMSYFLHQDHSTSLVESYPYYDVYTYASVTSVNGHARSTLKFCCTSWDCYHNYGVADECPTELNFVCQAYA